MHVSVLDFFDFVRITVMSESSEAGPVEVDGQRLVACDENIDSHIKLLATDEQGIHDVSLYNVRLCLGTFWFPSEIVFPLSDLCQFVKQEDTPSLGFPNRLHDPYTTNFSELFHKQRVISWQIVCSWKEVESNKKEI